MFRTVTFLTLISQFQYAISNIHTCVPNTQFLLNGLICSCNSKGQWSEASCLRVSRRQNCQPGHVVWQGCSQCICQENGQLLCNINIGCQTGASVVSTTKHEGLHAIGYKCTPFRIYYVDCNICICPAAGLTANAHCAKDTSCTSLKTPSTSDLLASVNKNLCLPKVMYLFACLHCLCSDEGYFILENCIEICEPRKEEARSCSPKSFYRKDCNVCFCPENMIPNDKYCTQEICNGTNALKVLNALRTSPSIKCTPYQFTPPRCLYCDCTPEGTINEHACLELSCLKFNTVTNKVVKETCNPGEMVSVCIECFCLRDGSTRPEYCSRVCSYRSKIEILERIFRDSRNDHLLDMNSLEKNTVMQSCMPNAIYANNGKFCLCPENGITDPKSCIIEIKTGFDFENPASEFSFKENKISIDFNATCEPSSFVQFDFNTCFCSKNGTIDPKWCTYDDCEAKKLVQDSQNAGSLIKEDQPNNCTPGSIMTLDCNFCICPENGEVKDRACTKNRCSEADQAVVVEKFTCEPLEYYEVDCNICLCPRDGKKNVAQCTKNLCEKSFLRTEVCVPGRLFSDECNVCVCPPKGNKADKACTRHRCQESALAWKNIYKLSNSILGHQISEVTTRKLDLCFPGEEFTMDCHLCVCPDMGIRSYATCTDTICDGTKSEISLEAKQNTTEVIQPAENPSDTSADGLARKSAYTPIPDADGCWIFNISASAERHDCTPGTMYIIRCRQCICPYMGNINDYCRPMREGEYCEQAYPGVNYLSMGRRQTANSTNVKPSHNHTSYDCDKPGKVMDKCFICECEEDKKIIKEHCFKNQDEECWGEEPSFLKEIKMLVLFDNGNYEASTETFKCYSHIHPVSYPGLNLEACDIGDVVENECIKCICSARNLYDCTSKGCPKTNNDENKADVTGLSCHPHKIYNFNETICICNPDGHWPHKSCHTVFRSLPVTNIIKQKCVPGSYVVIDCNICRCNDKGQIDNERCTKNECDPIKVPEHRRNSKSGQVYGKCRAKNWYSFGPCQFCYCLHNNKLMCNTGAKTRDAVKLGSYNFSVCGTDLLKEALELAPEGKEVENVPRINKDTRTPDSIKYETTTKAADKSNLEEIDLIMSEHNNNNDDDNDDDGKVKEQYVKAARSKIEKIESEDLSESDDGSEKVGEKFTKQPYVDSGNKERDTDNSGGRTEDRDDKNDENNSEDGSEESIPIKLTEKEQPVNIPVKSAEEEKPQGSISIKFDMNKVKNPLTQEIMPAKKRKRPSKHTDKKDEEDAETEEFDFGKAIKNNLPMMVSVLSNLRKSVNLDYKNDCEPGTRLQVQCNVCHCLKNKKMICTNNKCE